MLSLVDSRNVCKLWKFDKDEISEKENLQLKKIRIRSWRLERWFCDSQCLPHEKMSSEF